MSENKPLLFIETVQTEINQNIGQEIFDSRVHPQVDLTDVLEHVENHTVEEPIQQEKSSKVLQQARLLDKRAKQEHFVYVEINLREGESFKGFFKGLTNHLISLSEEEDTREIDIHDVVDISILKV